MGIRILLFASLAEIAGTHEINVNAEDFADIQSLFEKLVADFPALEAYRSSALLALNSEFAGPASPVKDGDEVAFFPPVSGG